MRRDLIPTYYRVKTALLKDIAQGNYDLERPFISESEVMSRFEVSRITAVRALNELGQDGILVRFKGRGTFVNPDYVSANEEAPAQRVPPPANSSRLIAAVFQRLHGLHGLSIIRSIERICRVEGYNLLLFDSDFSPQLEAENLQRAYHAGVEGIIAYAVNGFENAEHFIQLQEAGIPIIMVDRYYPALLTDVVVSDNIGLSFRLTDLLIREGHRSIMTVWEETNCTSVIDRYAGFRLALQQHQIPIRPEINALRSYFDLSPDEKQTLLDHVFHSPSRPTAVLAANGYNLELITADLLQQGIDVENTVTLASMDNSSRNNALSLGKVYAEVYPYEMGAQAMSLLLNHLHSTEKRDYQHLVLPIDLQFSKTAKFSVTPLSTKDTYMSLEKS